MLLYVIRVWQADVAHATSVYGMSWHHRSLAFGQSVGLPCLQQPSLKDMMLAHLMFLVSHLSNISAHTAAKVKEH